MKRAIVGIIIVSILSSFLLSSLQNWKISDDYSIKFSGNGAEGTFSKLTGTIVFDPQQLDQSNFDVLVDASTIDTGNKTKDKHARGSSWFDVEKYPNIGFKSSSFKRTADGYDVTGILDLHGVKKEITIPFTFSDSVFEGKFMVNRDEFEITGPFFGFVVGDEFDVVLKVPVTQ